MLRRCYEPWKKESEVHERVDAQLNRLEIEKNRYTQFPVKRLEDEFEAASEDIAIANSLDRNRAANDRCDAVKRLASSLKALEQDFKKDEEYSFPASKAKNRMHRPEGQEGWTELMDSATKQEAQGQGSHDIAAKSEQATREETSNTKV